MARGNTPGREPSTGFTSIAFLACNFGVVPGAYGNGTIG